MATYFHGDCLDIMKTLSTKSVDCFICDLPYGCITGAAKWDVKINLEIFWQQVKRLAKHDNVPVLMFCNTRFGYELIKSNESWYRYDIVWEKTNAVGFLRANKAPMTSHEMIYVFSKKSAFYNRIDIYGNFPKGGGGRSCANTMTIEHMPNIQTTEAGRRCVKSVVTIPNKKRKGGHPTEKPVELYEWLLIRYMPEGGTVLDPTAGSFNSIKVATSLGFKAMGIERDDAFFWKAISCI